MILEILNTKLPLRHCLLRVSRVQWAVYYASRFLASAPCIPAEQFPAPFIFWLTRAPQRMPRVNVQPGEDVLWLCFSEIWSSLFENKAYCFQFGTPPTVRTFPFNCCAHLHRGIWDSGPSRPDTPWAHCGCSQFRDPVLHWAGCVMSLGAIPTLGIKQCFLTFKALWEPRSQFFLCLLPGFI